jgi:DNA-binding MarR family transcriptional regulator
MLSAADRLVAVMGLSRNRWQILGTIAAADRPQPIAWLARDMGVNRQNIQRIANDLARARLVASQPNRHHRRARLVVPTERGKHTFDAAMRPQAPWINKLSKGLQVEDIETTHRVMMALLQKLEGDGNA